MHFECFMKIKNLYILMLFVGVIFSGCSKPPERLSIKNNDQLITLEWTDVTIEPVPVYWRGFKSGILTPLKKLDEKTGLKVGEELAQTSPPEDRYEPQITISEESHNKAIKHLSSIFQISNEAAKEALPPKDQWHFSIIYTDQTSQKLNSSPELFNNYLKISQEIPFESVKCDQEMLYKAIKSELTHLQSSKTLMSQVKPNTAYVIRQNSNPESILFIAFPEDGEWKSIDTYYRSTQTD